MPHGVLADVERQEMQAEDFYLTYQIANEARASVRDARAAQVVGNDFEVSFQLGGRAVDSAAERVPLRGSNRGRRSANVLAFAAGGRQ